MFKKVLLTFGVFALGAASATTLHITDPTWINGKELKPGSYALHVEGNEAVIEHGKTVVQVPVKVVQGSEKYPETQMLMSTRSGKDVLDEIRVGGSHTRIVVNPHLSGSGD